MSSTTPPPPRRGLGHASLLTRFPSPSANSDRRPVDPPPVVELRIYEGPSIEQGKLITFEYNANFFLYASLQSARTIAPGRAQNATPNNPPILTGVPASGMAYLDKPAEAGYFIFPDLSVRHEGTYKLSFSLFEMTKEERDYDLEPSGCDLLNGVDWRMEIETAPFSVFSAKKFPGLMESTALSRTVAEQGCRVRIRRDVRMRKRDGKPSNMDRREAEYTRHRTVTPAPTDDSRVIRARSISSSSEHRVPFSADVSRRPSLADSYPPATRPATFDQGPGVTRGHLTFDQASPQYAAPCPTGPPVPMSPGHDLAPQTPYVKAEHAYCRYPDGRIAAPPAAQGVKPDFYERRPSMCTPMPVPPSPSAYLVDGKSRRDSHALYPAPVPPRSKPTIQSKPPPSPMSITTLISDEPMELQPILEARQTLPAPAQMFKAGDKRKRDETFLESTMSLFNGNRPEEYHDRESAGDPGELGIYKRADGSRFSVSFLV